MSEDDTRGRPGPLDSRMDKLEHRMDQMEHRMDRLEFGLDALRTDVNTLRTDVNTLRGDVSVMRNDMSEMKATLAQLVPMMIRIDQRSSDSPKASEFYELRGRVEEISRHQPTTLAYAPPPAKTS